MKIAQLAPLWEPVPPARYGGIELVVSLLTEALLDRGHEITLFASGDSVTNATLRSIHNKALRLDPSIQAPLLYEQMQLADLYKSAAQFDIIHSHLGCASLSYASLVDTPTVHTTHGIFPPEMERFFQEFASQPFVSISDAQREPRLGLNYIATVYNGIEPNAFPFRNKPENPPYLAFLGRFSPEKGPKEAIQIAKAVGLPLKMAGKIDKVDRAFYEAEIKPLIDGEQIQFLGEMNHPQKTKLLGEAAVTLFPINWREPFGLVMIESMAVGTPVIARGLGSVPEVVAHGESGFICNSVEEMIAAVPEAMKLDRRDCRRHVVHHFSLKRMVDGYEQAYEQVLDTRLIHQRPLASLFS